jgi:hypothetical protein
MLHAAVEEWEERHPAAELRVGLDGDTAVFADTRRGRPARYALSAPVTAVYRCLESPHTLSGLRRALGRSDAGAYLRLGGAAGVRAALLELERAGAVWRDGERFVALALPEAPDFWIDAGLSSP